MQETLLDQIHSAEMEILREIDRICRAHGLTYFLSCGTLLGAVRHKGFIPWDEDMDVMMPREDYERFLQTITCRTQSILIRLPRFATATRFLRSAHSKIIPVRRDSGSIFFQWIIQGSSACRIRLGARERSISAVRFFASNRIFLTGQRFQSFEGQSTRCCGWFRRECFGNG